MIVLVLERASPSLRGELTRWLLEPRAGVFIGNVSALVREKLWEQVCAKCEGASALLIYSAPTEQGFAMRLFGEPSRTVEDFEGLSLVVRRRRSPIP
ncbi:MAG: type I-E CRISPR-associated endoribonuclease Cas2e [Dehalococcoidia bacterium]|nr:type I-E CRISPR-associated endoribonuclease Cas2e [Dehalococcoidia bacterium]